MRPKAVPGASSGAVRVTAASRLVRMVKKVKKKSRVPIRVSPCSM